MPVEPSPDVEEVTEHVLGYDPGPGRFGVVAVFRRRASAYGWSGQILTVPDVSAEGETLQLCREALGDAWRRWCIANSRNPDGSWLKSADPISSEVAPPLDSE